MNQDTTPLQVSYFMLFFICTFVCCILFIYLLFNFVFLENMASQNMAICNILAEQNVNLQQIANIALCNPSKYIDMFPIYTDDDLNAFEDYITD